MEMGVYLTTLEPRLGRETVKNNNWDKVAGNVDMKLDVCFEMPSSKVTRAKDRRDIQVHTGPIMLADYKWSCKNWESSWPPSTSWSALREGLQGLTLISWEDTPW